ncbi:MAG: rhomboid family intramembrane serine protease [Nocardioidaceae bacterium]
MLTSQLLIGINVAVWVLIAATGGQGSVWVDRLAELSQGFCGAGRTGGYYPNASQQACSLISGGHWVPGVADGAWWQLVTSMFTHVELLHIGFNMVALWVLGPQLEMIFGRARYLAVYFLSGLAGSALVYLLADPRTPTLGASGAIFGLMGALLVVTLKVHGNVGQIGMWIAINFAFTWFGANISWQGHVGGFVAGTFLATVVAFSPRSGRSAWQVVGCVLVAVLIAVAIVLRTLALT